MQEVTCTHCGRHVQITPDAPRCSQCGQDLHSLLIPQSATAYFYRRAADLAARGDLAGALNEAERGIDYHDASELRLLAAIISKRMGDMGTVRFHVAAIPVDDRLRLEAEWLIRAQLGRSSEPVDRQRSPASPLTATTEADSNPFGNAYGNPYGSAEASAFEGTNLEPAIGRAAPSPAQRPPAQVAVPDKNQPTELASAAPPPPEDTRGSLWVQRMWALVAIVLLIVAGSMGWVLLSGGPDALFALLPGDNPTTAQTTLETAPLAPITPAPLVLPTPTPQGTPTVPADLVNAPAAPIANSGLGSVVQRTAFDIGNVLTAAGRTDLAALDLNAQFDEGEVHVGGVVTNTTDRTAIIETVRAVHGVTDVSASELLVRIPATYTVQDGDSLWQIVTYFYGTDAAERVTELYALNKETLPSASSLQVGMELKMPSVD